MHSGFIWPRPCSALMLPFLLAVHSYTKGSMCDSISLSYLAASSNHMRHQAGTPCLTKGHLADCACLPPLLTYVLIFSRFPYKDT